MSGPLDWLFDATLTVAGQEVLWREIVGNLFGLASAVGGLRRKVWAWPIGIVGNPTFSERYPNAIRVSGALTCGNADLRAVIRVP